MAAFYGLDPDGWTLAKLKLFHDNIPALRAENILNSTEAAKLSPEGFYQITLAATGDKKLAGVAKASAALREMESKYDGKG